MIELPVLASDRFLVRAGDLELRCRSVTGLATTPAPDGAPAVVTLSRAVTTDASLFEWWQSAAGGGSTDSVDIVLLAGSGEPVVGWQLVSALPLQWIGPRLDALDAAPAMEHLQLSYKELRWLRLRR